MFLYDHNLVNNVNTSAQKVCRNEAKPFFMHFVNVVFPYFIKLIQLIHYH